MRPPASEPLSFSPQSVVPPAILDIDAIADEKEFLLHSTPNTSGNLLSTMATTTSTDVHPTAAARKVSTSRTNDTTTTNLKAQSLDKLDKASLSNRWSTFWTSFKYLYNLTPKQVDDFMASYVIYNLDWANEDEMIAALGPDYQSKVGECLQSYYGVLNHLCALGDVEKMYIPPIMDSKASVLDNQLLYERAMASAINARDGCRILDLGCGRGRVAAHVATVTGAHVTGINIDPNQIAQATQFSRERGLVGNEFHVRDFNDLPLPFPDESFDGFYQIQALSLCKDLPAMFRELYRLMRPGARISVLDWVRLPAYDPNNPEHADMMRRVKPLIGAVGTPTPEDFENAMREAGFVVTRSENASEDGLQAPQIERVDGYFRAMRQVVLALVKVRVLPVHFRTLINRFCLDGEAFTKMDRMRLVTTTHWLLGMKPEPSADEHSK